MKASIQFDGARCSACGACAIACMDQNDIDVEAGVKPLRRVFEGAGANDCRSVSCMHCDNAPCIPACPVGCITKEPETKLTVYDNAGCVGCRSCAKVCLYDAPSFGTDGKMIKCDGCIERLRHGLEPACVLACPTGALRLTE